MLFPLNEAVELNCNRTETTKEKPGERSSYLGILGKEHMPAMILLEESSSKDKFNTPEPRKEEELPSPKDSVSLEIQDAKLAGDKEQKPNQRKR
ncbi:hypothetical protein JRQ81_001740 [Phrynocephalus forsythii]|uniref:Uncharacterized protein n=1 Tax=Phrynocephalus forsythii TaxID=171643 RepID=A0A9Q0Y7T8_9SAUR|nr:hypothetical protein JRQ81_001740 [Phrynocephalus forsythii]